ncbi:MAG: hypothetical protein UCM69_01050 [Dialister invisus]|nr:hypothetical protein [Dialister invisus]
MSLMNLDATYHLSSLRLAHTTLTFTSWTRNTAYGICEPQL